MAVSARGVFTVLRHAVMLAMLVFIWLLLCMVYLERFISPFDRLAPLLMPWTRLHAMPAKAGVEGRLSFLQGILDASNRVSNLAFIVLITSFTLLSIYLTLLYQQKQRRARENNLLVIKNQEIARRNEFIRYISATISHEFKNNLGRIKRRIDLLPGIAAEAKERIDENMDKLFSDIEVFKKISDEREAVLADFTKVDLNEMIVKLARQYNDVAEIIMQSEIPPPSIFASKPLLKTVFENLIDNAIKYRKPEQERAYLTVCCSMDTDGSRRYVALSFQDRGIGMSEQQADKCFYKVQSTEQGWGEGLYFAKYVVGLHAGKIRVGKEHTAPFRGTEIIIHLPFVEESFGV